MGKGALICSGVWGVLLNLVSGRGLPTTRTKPQINLGRVPIKNRPLLNGYVKGRLIDPHARMATRMSENQGLKGRTHCEHSHSPLQTCKDPQTPQDCTRQRLETSWVPYAHSPSGSAGTISPTAVTGECGLISETITKPPWRSKGTSMSPHPMESEFPRFLGKVIHRLKMR